MPNALMLLSGGSDTYTVEPAESTATPSGADRRAAPGRGCGPRPNSDTYVPLASNTCTRRFPVSAT